MTTPDIATRGPAAAPETASAKGPAVETKPPPAVSPAEDQLVRVYAWDVVVRVTHWTVALSILGLSITGIYIGHPYIVVPGEARFHFVMGTMKVVHFYFAIAFTLAVLSRILWMFIGSRNARWTMFIPTTRKRWKAFGQTLAFYLFLRRKPPSTPGHNPVAGAAYSVVFVIYLVMIVSGLGLYAAIIEPGSVMSIFRPFVDLFGGAASARWWHHVSMWLLIGFFVHHLYSAILTAVVERNGTLDSIFSGWKWMKKKDLEA